MQCVKDLAESNTLTSIPAKYTHHNNSEQDAIGAVEKQLPTIDFSLLTSASPNQRSKTIQELAQACQDWGFLMVINHGVSEILTESMLAACKDFFNQTQEEKLVSKGKNLLDPIRYGTSFNASIENVLFWRDHLKVVVHPRFHSPLTPPNFSDVSFEYCKRTRQVARELLKGISESLGLERTYIDNAMELDSSFQTLVANLYPPCPQPELAMGMPPHTDHGLLTLLIQNQIGGLQIEHNGKWVAVNPLPNSFLVNIGDHLEILSNGKYKSVVHRVVVNNKVTRISVGTAHGPSSEIEVTPAPDLVDNKNNPPAYLGMKYKAYIEMQQSNPLDRKSCLDRIRV